MSLSQATSYWVVLMLLAVPRAMPSTGWTHHPCLFNAFLKKSLNVCKIKIKIKRLFWIFAIYIPLMFSFLICLYRGIRGEEKEP